MADFVEGLELGLQGPFHQQTNHWLLDMPVSWENAVFRNETLEPVWPGWLSDRQKRSNHHFHLRLQHA